MAVLLTFPAVATTACDKRRDDPSTTRTTGATDMPDAAAGLQASSVLSARTLLAGARCDREGACNHVGPAKRFETRELCTREENNRAQCELRSSDCPNGVDDKKLQTCLDVIAKQDCARTATADECATSVLCATRP